jgi:predicted permease
MPDFREYVRSHLEPLGVSGEQEAEIVEEVALEFQENYERACRGGLSAEEAWQDVCERARPWPELARELRSALREEAAAPQREERPRRLPWRLLDGLWRDVVYGARQLRNSPGFTTVAVLMLALGIGGNTAIFSLLNAILLRELPVSHPAQLVFLGPAEAEGFTRSLSTTGAFSYPFFREFRRRNEVFSNVAAVESGLMTAHGRVAGNAEMERLEVELVSGSYFPALGVKPARGRLLTDADDQRPGGHPIAVANYDWWRARMAGDPAILRKTVQIGSTAYAIVGVAAPHFSGVTVGRAPDLWIPLAMQKEVMPDRNGRENVRFESLHLIGRMKPGVLLAQAQANADLLFHQIQSEFARTTGAASALPDIQRARLELTPAATGRSGLRREFSSPLLILMTVVALVLLIACANVANLLLARSAARRREVAVRMSMGAERPRLIRQLLAESSLLGFAGAALGVLFASGASRLMVATVSPESPLSVRVTPDARVLAFTILVTVVTVLLFGIAPAWRTTGLDLAGVLRAGRGLIGHAGPTRLTHGLVIGQVALSVLLLAGAGLFLESLSNLTHVNTGFDRANALVVATDTAAAGYRRDERLISTMQRIEERIAAVPGVHSASFAGDVFDGGGSSTTNVRVPGRPQTDDDPRVELNRVGAGYLDAMKIPVILGRGLSARDNAASRKVAVINETMVRTHFGGASPLGRTFSVGSDPEWQNVEVVGVMKDAKYMELEEEQMPAAFFPYAQQIDHFLNYVVVRYSGDPAVIGAGVRKAVREIDGNLPVAEIRPLAELVDRFTRNHRLVTALSALFGILAALLACIGIYGVMSYGIARRTNEFGVRMALGATRGAVLGVVLRETAWLALAGSAIGLGLAMASGTAVKSVLIGVKGESPLVLGLPMVVMIAVALFAGYLPARRATRIDPSTALRYE